MSSTQRARPRATKATTPIRCACKSMPFGNSKTETSLKEKQMKSIMKKLAVVAAAGALALSASAGNITVKGSDTLVILAQKWAEVYMSKNSGTKIQVTGGGSGTGFAALQNKTTDIANASRKIRAAEITACVKAFGKRPTEYKVALDGLSVYV